MFGIDNVRVIVKTETVVKVMSLVIAQMLSVTN